MHTEGRSEIGFGDEADSLPETDVEEVGVKDGDKESKIEKAKKIFYKGARWVALGAALLVAGCSRETDPAKDQLKAKTEVLHSFDFENSFPVDQAELNTDAQSKIMAQVSGFLDKYNTPEQFQKLVDSRIKIEVSSDERATQKWEKGNEGLSEARLMQLDMMIRSILANYKYSKDVKATQVENVKRKTFIKRMPGGAWGVGFTPLTQLTNPETNQKYTQEEVGKLDKKKLNELYEQARYANVSFELPGEDEKYDQYGKLVEILANYDKVTLLLDRSGSMEDDYSLLSKKFQEQYTKLAADFETDTTYIVPFESDADLETDQNIPAKEVPKYLADMKLFGSNELVFNSLQQVLDKKTAVTEAEPQPSAVLILTDEGIQDFDIQKLEAMNGQAEKSKVDVYFALVGEDGLITFFSQEGLIHEYKQLAAALADPEYYDFDMDEKSRQEHLAKEVRGIQLDDKGNLVFKFNAFTFGVALSNRLYQAEREIINRYYEAEAQTLRTPESEERSKKFEELKKGRQEELDRVRNTINKLRERLNSVSN
jgi:hypothetical protein